MKKSLSIARATSDHVSSSLQSAFVIKLSFVELAYVDTDIRLANVILVKGRMLENSAALGKLSAGLLQVEVPEFEVIKTLFLFEFNVFFTVKYFALNTSTRTTNLYCNRPHVFDCNPNYYLSFSVTIMKWLYLYSAIIR